MCYILYHILTTHCVKFLILSFIHFLERKRAFLLESSFFMVRPAGLEPARCYPYAPQTYASADSAMAAYTRREITSSKIILDFQKHFNTFLLIS